VVSQEIEENLKKMILEVQQEVKEIGKKL